MGCNKRGQTGTEIASQRERATMPTSEEFLEGSGSLAYEDLNLDIDSADVSAGRDDVRDNFDFDSFLKKDEEGMGFDFANSAGGKKEGVGHAQAYPPQPQLTRQTRHNLARSVLTRMLSWGAPNVHLYRHVRGGGLSSPNLL